MIVSIKLSKFYQWLFYTDPQANAYIKDESGNSLSIAEVRERLIGGRPLLLNATANYHQVLAKKEVSLYSSWINACIP